MPTRLDLASLDAVVTSDCNLRCRYCYQNAKQPGRIDWRDLRAGLDLILASSRRSVRILFTGGEPLLTFPLIRRAVRYVEDRARAGLTVAFDLSTNGTLLGPREAAFLADHAFDVQLSFDGVGEAQDLRAPGTFKRLDVLLDRLRRDQPEFFMRRLSVGITLVPETVRFLARSAAYFLAEGIPEILITPAIGAHSGWRREHIGRLERQFARMHAACLRHYQRTGAVPLRVFRHPARAQRVLQLSDWYCSVGDGRALTIDVDGHLTGCVLFARSYQRFPKTAIGRAVAALQLGHVREPGLVGRLASYGEAVRRTGVFNHRRRKRSSYGRCATCRYCDECSFCPACIVHQAGNADPDRVPDFVCAFNRVSSAYRRAFPVQPSVSAITGGRVPVPLFVREMLGRLSARGVPRSCRLVKTRS